MLGRLSPSEGELELGMGSMGRRGLLSEPVWAGSVLGIQKEGLEGFLT